MPVTKTLRWDTPDDVRAEVRSRHGAMPGQVPLWSSSPATRLTRCSPGEHPAPTGMPSSRALGRAAYVEDGPLNSRERVQRAIQFERPDRVPISHAVLPAASIKYGEALDEILTDLPRGLRLGLHGRSAARAVSAALQARAATSTISGQSGRWRPRASAAFRWNGPSRIWSPTTSTSGRRFSRPARPLVACTAGTWLATMPRWYARGAWITYFEQLQQLRGHGELPDGSRLRSAPASTACSTTCWHFNLRWIEAWTKLEYDGLHFADDWGGQSRLMIRPAVAPDLQAPLCRDVPPGPRCRHGCLVSLRWA